MRCKVPRISDVACGLVEKHLLIIEKGRASRRATDLRAWIGRSGYRQISIEQSTNQPAMSDDSARDIEPTGAQVAFPAITQCIRLLLCTVALRCSLYTLMEALYLVNSDSCFTWVWLLTRHQKYCSTSP
jgi:hypothetical protein